MKKDKLVKIGKYLLIVLVLFTSNAGAVGEIYSWGSNPFGELGDGTTINRLIPVQVNVLADTTAIDAGSNHSLALKSDGTVWAWGRNIHGQLGDSTTIDRSVPVQVNGLAGITTIVAGSNHSLAVKSDGTVWAWGSNSNGQLGDGTTNDRLVPVQVMLDSSPFTGVVAVAAGLNHSLAIKSDGTVWAWGSNDWRKLGDGTYIDRHNPVHIDGISNVVAIYADDDRSYALKSDGTVWIWGYYLHLDTTTHFTPLQIIRLSNIIAIAASNHSLINLKSDNTVWAISELDCNTCHNPHGSLYSPPENIPVQVNGLSNVVGVAKSADHSLALKSDGTVWAWGSNNVGQLGDGTTTNRLVPVQVNGLVDATKIAVGDIHSLAISSFNFNLAVTPQSQTLRPGGSAIFTVDATLLGGAVQNVGLGVTIVNAATGNSDSSITSSVSPSSVPLGSSATVFVGTSPTTLAGTYNIIVTGESGVIQKTVAASITVSGQPLPNNPVAMSSYTVKLVTGDPLTDQIKVPVTGSFVIVLSGGSTFSVIDNYAIDGFAKVQIIDNKIYKIYGRVTGGKSGVNMNILSPLVLGVLTPQHLMLPKASPPTTIDLTSLSPYILQIPVSASIVDTSKSWVSSNYPSNGLPYSFTNNDAQETQLIFVLQ